MKRYADKTEKNKSHSVSNSVTQKKSETESTFQFVDNRPEAVLQRKLQRMTNAYTPIPIKSEKGNQPGVIQRVLIYQGQQFKSMRDLAMSETKAYDTYRDSKDPDKRKKRRPMSGPAHG